MYQLIALDMDGTLLNENHIISEKNHQTIAALKAMGKKIVLATGRPYNGVKRYLAELNLLDEGDYVVTCNGAQVQRTKDSHILVNNPLNLDAFKELYKLSKELGVHIQALSTDKVYTPKKNPYTQIESDANLIPIIETEVENIGEENLIIKVMFVGDEKNLDAITPKIPQWAKDKYSIQRSGPIYLEFLNLKANKGTGVDAIIKELGLKQNQVICVGDAQNDLAMIKYAKLGVAMENATEELKGIADYVTLSNNDDGVAHVIEKFML